MEYQVEWAEVGKHLQVKVPFEIKDSFRSAFPKAKWQSDTKLWLVDKAFQERLIEWAGEAQKRLEEINEQLAELAEKKISNKELEALEEEISLIKYRIKAKEQELRSAEECIKAIGESKAIIKSLMPQLEVAAKNLEAAEKEKAKALLEHENFLESTLDMPAIHSAITSLARNHNPARGQVARSKFKEAQETIKAEADKLASAGLKLVALEYLLGMNFNRPDRDAVENMPENAWNNIVKIEGEIE